MKNPRSVAFELACAYLLGACMGGDALMERWWLIVLMGAVVVGGGYWHERLRPKATTEHPS